MFVFQAIPADAQYRVNVEKFTNYRLSICETETDPEVIERKIMQGQVEELIEQAEDELNLIPLMAEWKPWVVPEGHVTTFKIQDEEGIWKPPQ